MVIEDDDRYVLGDADALLVKGPKHAQGGHQVPDQQRGRPFCWGELGDLQGRSMAALLGVVALDQPAVVEGQPVAGEAEEKAALTPQPGVRSERARDVSD